MLVNNQKIDQYGARLLDYTVGGTQITNDYIRGNQCITPVLFNTDIGMRTLSVTLTFSGKDREDTVSKMSSFACEIRAKSEINLPDGFIYTCILTGISDAVEIMPNYQEVNYTFDAVQHKELVKQALTFLSLKSNVYCTGNVDTDCVFEIRPTTNIASFTINGITIKGLTANKTLIIDGIKRTVTQDGINKFATTDLIDFPKLKPGINEIKVSTAVPVSVSFYPIFI